MRAERLASLIRERSLHARNGNRIGVGGASRPLHPSLADGKPATLLLAVAAGPMLGEQPATDYGEGTAINAEPTAAPQN